MFTEEDLDEGLHRVLGGRLRCGLIPKVDAAALLYVTKFVTLKMREIVMERLGDRVVLIGPVRDRVRDRRRSARESELYAGCAHGAAQTGTGFLRECARRCVESDVFTGWSD